MNDLTRIGGARLALRNATWPLARLHANRAVLEIDIPGASMCFTPAEVVALQPMFGLWLSPGLRVVHTRFDRADVVFWCLFPGSLRRRILRAGFIPAGELPSTMSAA